MEETEQGGQEGIESEEPPGTVARRYHVGLKKKVSPNTKRESRQGKTKANPGVLAHQRQELAPQDEAQDK
jgi:hypothetical protein